MDKNGQQPEKKENKFVISPEIERHMQILRKDPKSPVFAILSEAYRKGGLLDEAIAVATDGLKYNPNYVSGRVALARAYLDKGELDKAEEEFKKVVKSTPDNIISHKLLADIYIKKSDINTAIQELKTVLFLSPEDKEAKNLLNTIKTSPEPAKGEQGNIASAENVQPQTQEPVVKVSEATEEAKEVEAKKEPPKVLETPTEKQETQPIEQIKPETIPMPEEKMKVEEQIQPAQAVEVEKIEDLTAETKQEEKPSVDMELENVLEKPLIEQPLTEQTEQPIKEQSLEIVEQQVLEPVSEQVESHEQEAPKESKLLDIETRVEPEPEKGAKAEELESAFEELVESAETPQPEQTESAQAEQSVSKQEERIEPEGFEVDKYAEAPLEVSQEQVSAPTIQEQKPSTPKQEIESHEDIQTVTMADLYVKQGHLEKAYQIYKTILQKTPDNPIIRAKLIKVKKLLEAKQQDELDKQKFEALKEQESKVPIEEQSDAMKENMKRLSAWLEKIKKGG